MNLRLPCAALVAAAVLAASRAGAQDAEPPYFAAHFDGWIQRIAAGPDGSVFVAGNSSSVDLPGAIEPPPDDATTRMFVSRWTADGRVLWTAYLPFQRAYTQLDFRGLRVAEDGSVWAAFPVANFDTGYLGDVCVAHLAADGSLLASTLLGGPGFDHPIGLVLAPGGDVIVAGTTQSDDFPVTIGPSPPLGRTPGTFVARLAAVDLSVVWSRRLDAAGSEVATALADDATGVLVARSVIVMPYYYQYGDYDQWQPVTDVFVTRVSFDGAVEQTVSVPHTTYGAVTSIAPLADGHLAVGGLAGYDSGSDAFAMRLDPATGAVDALWKERSQSVAKVVALPSGEILVGTELRFVDVTYPFGYAPPGNVSRLRVLTPDLREASTLLDQDELRSIEDFAVASDGAVCVAGHGAPVAFNPVAPEAVGWFSHVARLPLRGAAPASSVTTGPTAKGSVAISWSGGDAASRYELEQLRSDANGRAFGYDVVATAPADARSVVVAVADAASAIRFRLVSVFPSGVRSATRTFATYTLPSKPAAFSAAPVDRGILLRWSMPLQASSVRMELQRRIDGGPWRRVTRSPWRPRDVGDAVESLIDGLPRLGTMDVAYRMRSVLVEGSGASAWTYSREVRTPPPTLHVTQTSGSVRAGDCPGNAYFDAGPLGPPRLFQMAGTFAAAPDASVPPFDAMHHDFRIWFGAPASPMGIEIPAGSPRWKRHGGGWTWSSWAETDSRWTLSVDAAAGTFTVIGCIHDAADFMPNADTVLVGIAYGKWSGGSVRRWTRLPGPRPNLVLR